MNKLLELNAKCRELFDAVIACQQNTPEYEAAKELWLSAEEYLKQSTEAYERRTKNEID